MTYSLLYILLTAFSAVFIHGATNNYLHPALMLFCSTILAIVYFHCINLHQLGFMYRTAWQAKKYWIGSMLAVAVIWLASVYGLNFVAPSVFVLLYFAMNCLLGICFDYYKNKTPYLLLMGAMLIICTIALVGCFLHFNQITHLTYLGILLSLIGGIAVFVYSKQSYHLATKSNLKATQIVAIRFWLILPLTAILAPEPHHILNSLSWQNAGIVIIVALVSLIIPIFFFMKAVIKIGPEKNAILCGLTPAITYIIEAYALHSYNSLMLSLNLITGFFIALPTLVKFLKNQRIASQIAVFK